MRKPRILATSAATAVVIACTGAGPAGAATWTTAQSETFAGILNARPGETPSPPVQAAATVVVPRLTCGATTEDARIQLAAFLSAIASVALRCSGGVPSFTGGLSSQDSSSTITGVIRAGDVLRLTVAASSTATKASMTNETRNWSRSLTGTGGGGGAAVLMGLFTTSNPVLKVAPLAVSDAVINGRPLLQGTASRPTTLYTLTRGGVDALAPRLVSNTVTGTRLTLARVG